MLNQARIILATHMRDSWTKTEIAWANTPPKTIENKCWVRFTVLGGAQDVPCIGPQSPLTEKGFAVVQVFAPGGAGDGMAGQLADEAARLFRRFESGPLFCGVPEKKTVGTVNGWFQINVSVPWEIYGPQ